MSSFGLLLLAVLASAPDGVVIPPIDQGGPRPEWLVTLWDVQTDAGVKSLVNVCGGAVTKISDDEIWFTTAAHCLAFSYVTIGSSGPHEFLAFGAYRVAHDVEGKTGDVAVYSLPKASFPLAESAPSVLLTPQVWMVRLGAVSHQTLTSQASCQSAELVVDTPISCFALSDTSGFAFRPGDSGSAIISPSGLQIISERDTKDFKRTTTVSGGVVGSLGKLDGCNVLRSEACVGAAQGLGLIKHGTAYQGPDSVSASAKDILERFRKAGELGTFRPRPRRFGEAWPKSEIDLAVEQIKIKKGLERDQFKLLLKSGLLDKQIRTITIDSDVFAPMY